MIFFANDHSIYRGLLESNGPLLKMMTKNVRLITVLSVAVFVTANAVPAYSQTIVYPSQGSNTEWLAAKEVRRYIFLRTGTAPALAKVTNARG